jgi:hypothetical protein
MQHEGGTSTAMHAVAIHLIVFDDNPTDQILFLDFEAGGKQF